METALESLDGTGTAILQSTPLGGGCVSPVARLETSGGARYFLKWDAGDLPAGLLEAEARGLERLRAARALRVPAVRAGGQPGSRWLLLEWLEPGAPDRGSWSALGAGLAGLHRTRGARFGADRPNFIGPLHQDNREMDSWPAFWRGRRLEPQLRIAADGGAFDRADLRRFDRLLNRLDGLLAAGDEDGPSLLHGDLWSGNVHMMAGGEPAVIDPSAYHGHREVDLAMADLFGGFPSQFRSAYEEAWPLLPEADRRRPVYQLYYLLVHVNLFGAGYVGRTLAALSAAGA